MPATAAVLTTTTPPGAAFRLDGVRLGRAGGGAVLDGLGLRIRAGEVLAVVGPSGCGKSTLLRTLAGLLPPLSGTVTQDGTPITRPDADRALIFQDDALLPWRTARGNVELPLAIRRVPRAERRRTAGDWLARVGLAEHAHKLPHQLSGGQRQRVQLARALAARPAPSSWTSPSARSTPRPAPGCRTSWSTPSPVPGQRSSSSPTTWTRPSSWATASRCSACGTVVDVPLPRDRSADHSALRRRILSSL